MRDAARPVLNNATMPLTLMSGGLIPPCCPLTPSAPHWPTPRSRGCGRHPGRRGRCQGPPCRRPLSRHRRLPLLAGSRGRAVGALRTDRNECVRWEAALALGRGCCCTKKTIEALTIVVSCSDRDGSPKETSHRVHAAAAAALDRCLSCYANVAAAAPDREADRADQSAGRGHSAAANAAAARNLGGQTDQPRRGQAGRRPDPRHAAAGRYQTAGRPEYYAHVAKAPLAAVLAEARRVAEKQHATPVVAETPFDSQGHTVAALMSYATGPDTQTVIPAGASVPAGEVRAEVVSAKPENLWDLMAKPSNPGQVVVVRPETVVVQPPAPPKQIVVKRELVVVKPEPVVKRNTVVSDPFVAAPAPVAKKLTLTPAPMPGPAPMPKGESLTLDFPPPTAPYSPPAANYPPATMAENLATKPTGPSPYFAKAATPTIINRPSVPDTSALSSYHATAATPAPRTQVTVDSQPAGPSPYFATAATPTIVNRPSVPDTSALSSYHATAATPAPRTQVTVDSQPTGPSPYFATAATPTIINRPSVPDTSALSSYHATAATPAPRTQVTVDSQPTGPSPYFATAATPTIINRPSVPDTSAVSSYHATAATASTAKPLPTLNNTPSTSPYNIALPPAPAKPVVVKATPAPLQVPANMTATPLSTKPMPAPAAPVVPAAITVVPAMPVNGDIIQHLLQTARGNGPAEVRKASIEELAKMKANTPEVMVALDSLSDDPVPAVRAEAIIAAARLRMGR